MRMYVYTYVCTNQGLKPTGYLLNLFYCLYILHTHTHTYTLTHTHTHTHTHTCTHTHTHTHTHTRTHTHTHTHTRTHTHNVLFCRCKTNYYCNQTTLIRLSISYYTTSLSHYDVTLYKVCNQPTESNYIKFISVSL